MKRLLIGCCLTLGLLFTVTLVANAIWISTTGTRLEEQIESLRSTGEYVYITEISQRPLAPEENAFTYLRRAEVGAQAANQELEQILAEQDWQHAQLTEVQQARVAELVEAFPEPFELLQQAAACDRYNSQLDYSLTLAIPLPHCQTFRALARLADAKARLHIARGEPDQALDLACQVWRVARHLQSEPVLISYLVACAGRQLLIESANLALRSGGTTQPMRDRLAAELAKHDTLEPFVASLKGERALGMSVFQQLRSGELGDALDQELPSGWALSSWFARGYLNGDQAFYLQILSEMVEVADAPYADNVAKMRQLEQRLQAAGARHAITGMLAPALTNLREVADRSRAQVRCLQVINAAAGDQGLPDSLELSQLGLADAATLDPFTDAPLRMVQTPQGWVVYSVGTNLKDDGGAIHEPDQSKSDVGLGP